MTVYAVFWYDPTDTNYPEVLIDIWSTNEDAETRIEQLRNSHSANAHNFYVQEITIKSSR